MHTKMISVACCTKCHFSMCRSGTEEDLNEKLILLQEISDKEEEGKRMAKRCKEQQAAAEKVHAVQQEKVDARLSAFRAGVYKAVSCTHITQIVHTWCNHRMNKNLVALQLVPSLETMSRTKMARLTTTTAT